MGAKAGFVGFVLGFLVSSGFFDAKVFFSVVREGVADKPGDILCSFFFVLFRGFGACLGARGSRDFIFFTGTLWKGSFLGKIREASFCLFFCSPSLFFVFVFSMYLMFFFCYNFGVRGFLWTRFLSC